MTGREKKRINKEIAAVASLRDSDIDTSDIPEVFDWSNAVVGRFHRATAQLPQLQDRGLGSFNEGLQYVGSPHQSNATQTVIFAELTHQQLIAECLRSEAAWSEFMRRWNQLIAMVVMRAARRWGTISSQAVEDLIQDVYVKLTADNFKLLRQFDFHRENALLAFIKMVATNVVYDHFRSISAQKSGINMESISIESASDQDRTSSRAAHESLSAMEMENAAFLEEVDRALMDIASDKERTIFRLYYRQGFSAKEIAALPMINLTVKGVESMIGRLTERLKSHLTQRYSLGRSQKKLRPPR